jgi:hypothetical protein
LRQDVINLQRLHYGLGTTKHKGKTTMEQELAELRSKYRTSMLVQCLMRRLGRVNKVTDTTIQIQLIFPVCPLTSGAVVNTPTRHVIVAMLDLPRNMAIYMYREQEEVARRVLRAEMQVGQYGANQIPLIVGGGGDSSGRMVALNFEAIAGVNRNGGVAGWFWTKFISTMGSVENDNRRSMGNIQIMTFEDFSNLLGDCDFDTRANKEEGVGASDPDITEAINEKIREGDENATRWVRLNKSNEFRCAGENDTFFTGLSILVTPVVEAARNLVNNTVFNSPYTGAATGAAVTAAIFGPGSWAVLIAGLGGAAAQVANEMNSYGKVAIYGCTSSMEAYFRDTTPGLNRKISWPEWMRGLYDKSRSNIEI